MMVPEQDILTVARQNLANAAAHLTQNEYKLNSVDATFDERLVALGEVAKTKELIADHLITLDHHDAAVIAAQRAVSDWRELISIDKENSKVGLARALDSLGRHLRAAGRQGQARRAIDEAVALRRELAAARPEDYRPDLAASLNNLAAALSALGRREAALAAAEEAAAVYRELAAARPDAFRPDLALSLYNLASHLDAGQRAEEALAANREAVEALSAPFCALPRAFAHWMGPRVLGYVEGCEKLGREPDGELLGPIVEAFQRLQGEAGEGNPQ